MRTTLHGEPFTIVDTVKETVSVVSARMTETTGNAFFTGGQYIRVLSASCPYYRLSVDVHLKLGHRREVDNITRE
jgi:hypothetical protein